MEEPAPPPACRVALRASLRIRPVFRIGVLLYTRGRRRVAAAHVLPRQVVRQRLTGLLVARNHDGESAQLPRATFSRLPTRRREKPQNK